MIHGTKGEGTVPGKWRRVLSPFRRGYFSPVSLMQNSL